MEGAVVVYRYVTEKLVLALPTFLIVSIVVFTLIRLVPGDPAILLLGDIQNPAELDRLRRNLGLDQPIVIQFGIWLKNVLVLDLGRSVITQLPVLPTILESFQVTATIVIAVMAVSIVVAVPLGVIAAWRQNRPADLAIVTFAVVCLSVPSFWVGLMLLLGFGVKLHWLPVIGYVSPFDDFIAGLRYLILPVVALVFVHTGGILRLIRSATIEVLRQEYVTNARSKGLSEPTVLTRHVLKNSFTPALSLLGYTLATMLGGVAVIESVFTLPGLGRLLVESIYARDYPMVQGITLFIAVVYIVVNLVVDLLYPLFDPKVRLE